MRPDSDETIALRMMVRARHDLTVHRIAVHNKLLAVLQHNFPGAIGLFSQLDISISLAFLRRFPCNTKLRAALVDWAQVIPRRTHGPATPTAATGSAAAPTPKDPVPGLDRDPLALLARPCA